MQLVSFCIVLVTFAGVLCDRWLEMSAGEHCLSWSLGGVAFLGAITKFQAWRCRRRVADSAKIRSPITDFESQRNVGLWSWIVLAPFYYAAVGWGDFGETHLDISSSITGCFVWWSLPTLFVMTLIDAARFQFYRSLGISTPNFIRHTWLILMAPCCATGVLWDLSVFGLSQSVSLNPPLYALIGFVCSLVMVLVIPVLILKVWSTEVLASGAAADVVKKTWVASGGHPQAIRFWRTDSTAASALVVGWFYPWRYLIVSDLLLAKLDRDELKMIILHEAAHCRRCHVWLRLIPVWLMSVPIFIVHLEQVQPWLARLPCSPAMTQYLVTLLSLAATCWLLSWIARRTEHDADQAAVELACKDRSISLDGVRCEFSRQIAARVLVRALEKLTPPACRFKRTWLHPSLQERMESLRGRYFMESGGLLKSLELRETLPEAAS